MEHLEHPFSGMEYAPEGYQIRVPLKPSPISHILSLVDVDRDGSTTGNTGNAPSRGTREVLDAVFTIAETAVAGGELDDLYRAIHDIVGRLMPARNFYIALTDDEQRTLRFPYFVDERDSPPEPAIRPLGRGLTAYLLRARRAMLLDRFAQEELEREGEAIIGGPFAWYWMGAPLAIGGRVLGVIVVQTYDPAVNFGAGDLEILSFVARQVALVLQHKQAEERLQEANRTLRTLVDNLPGVAYRCANDLAWTMEYVSSGIRELTGWPAEELLGNRKLSFASLIDLQDRRKVWDEVQRALTEHRPWTLEYRIRTAGGELKWIWERGSGIFAGGELVALEGFFTDVTERRKAEEESARLAKERREALRREAVGRLAEGMADDLRAILAPALHATDRLAAGRAAGGRAAVVRTAVLHALDHIDRLLAAGRRPASAVQIVDLRRLVADREREIRSRLPRRIALKIRLGDRPVPVRTDAGLLTEVLDALVARALDAVPRRGTIVVAVDRPAGGALATLAVSDTGSGAGIARGLNEPHPPGGDAGLSFLRSIAEQLGGEIEAVPEDGGGTRLRVMLPATEAGPS
jgi:PAS domain S-box-containing protein